MNTSHKELISIGLSIAILIATLCVIHRFIPSLVWAAIIVIASYPVYQRWHRFFGERHNLSALLFTLILSLLIILPLSWLVSILVRDLQFFVNYLQVINRDGGEVPLYFKQLPLVGNEIETYWNANVAHPGNIKQLLSNLHLSLTSTSYYVKQVGVGVAHRSFQLGFTLLTLFFFYRDGDHLFHQINRIGENCLGKRWFRYAEKLPVALRSIVNGTVVVGIGVGILTGVCYALVDLPGPAVLGFITAFSAMIPFLVSGVFAILGLILLANGSMLSAIIVVVWGTLVMFIADHFVKPVLIGGAIRLPFLAVLFGILGGVETVGLLGLFVGPIIMVLFMTLWYESQGIDGL